MLRRVGLVGSRRFAQTRGFDFAKLSEKLSSETSKKAVAELRVSFDQLQQIAKDSSRPVPPVDWDYYRSEILDRRVVDDLEKQYNELKIPDYETIHFNKVKELVDAALAKSEEMNIEAKSRLEEYTTMLKELEANRVDDNTLISDIVERYPEIAEEAKAEMEQGEYFKDTIEKSSD